MGCGTPPHFGYPKERQNKRDFRKKEVGQDKHIPLCALTCYCKVTCKVSARQSLTPTDSPASLAKHPSEVQPHQMLFNTKQLSNNKKNLLFICEVNGTSQARRRHEVDYHFNRHNPNASVHTL